MTQPPEEKESKCGTNETKQNAEPKRLTRSTAEEIKRIEEEQKKNKVHKDKPNDQPAKSSTKAKPDGDISEPGKSSKKEKMDVEIEKNETEEKEKKTDRKKKNKSMKMMLLVSLRN